MQILLNLVFYAFLAWLFYETIWVEHDPWFAFVVGFVIFVSAVVQFMPGLHVSKVSPGEYPYEAAD
jgi:Na+-translocating ferredoxin:NAD+ oxidoreductase RnfA subunit